MSHIIAIVGSLNKNNCNAAKNALMTVFPNYLIEVISKETNSGVNSQPIGVTETKTGAINRMQQCYSLDMPSNPVFCIGIENGLVLGKELNDFFSTNKYSESHWYDIGICAITVYKWNSSFKYISYAEPLKIPKELLSPCTPEENAVNIKRYQSFIMPLISEHFDLYDRFSNGILSREGSLTTACINGIHRLNNISYPKDAIKYDTVLMFGTFDMLHDLHKRLLDHASATGKRIFIGIYSKAYKYKGTQKVFLQEDVQTRLEHVAEYLLTKHKNIVVERMLGSHPTELKKAITKYSQLGTLALMGGDDQYQDYDKILDICFNNHIPIVCINRGETKTKLCSTDIRRKMSYQRIVDIYNLEMDVISAFFWKQSINSKLDAKMYLQKQLAYAGLVSTEVWKFIPDSPFDQQILTEVDTASDKIILCLPGRTLSNQYRIRKIGLTIQNDFVPKEYTTKVSIYVGCYEQNSLDTRHRLNNLNNLSKDNRNFFSDDAMIFTKTVIMPCICKNLSIRKIEDVWNITRLEDFTFFAPRSGDVANLSKIILFARSMGSVIVLEMENAFRYIMIKLGFDETYIRQVAKKINVLSISNLAPFDRPRIFHTFTITGLNDKKALKHIKWWPISTMDVDCTSLVIQDHHCIFAQIPSNITESGTNKEISDNDCHYTPLYTAFREHQDNTVPKIIRSIFESMII